MIEIKKLLEAGVHFGHRTSRWSPQMKPFIWGAKNKIHLIDVAKTAFLLERAANFLKDASRDGGSILWVGTKKAARDHIQKIGASLDMPFVIHRWIGGTLSNFNQVKKAMTRLLFLQEIVAKASPHHSKKEISAIQKEILRLEKNIGGILNFTFPPSAIVIVDAKREDSALKEASRLGIPVVAMVDTNTDPTGIPFVIPSNDDSPKAIECVLGYLAQAVADGKKVFAQTQKTQKSVFTKTAVEKPQDEALRETLELIAKEESLETIPVKKTAPNTVVAEVEAKVEMVTPKEVAPKITPKIIEEVKKPEAKKAAAKPTMEKPVTKPIKTVVKEVAPKKKPTSK